MKVKKTLKVLAVVLIAAGLASCSGTSSSVEPSSSPDSSTTDSSTADSSTDDSSEIISSEDSTSDDSSSEGDSSGSDSSDGSSSSEGGDSSEPEEPDEPDDPEDTLDLSTFENFVEYYNDLNDTVLISNASYTEGKTTSSYSESTTATFTSATDQTLYTISYEGAGTTYAYQKYKALEQDETYGEIYYDICHYTSGGTDYGYKRQLIDSTDDYVTGPTISQGLKSKYEPEFEESFFDFDTINGSYTVPFSAFADTSNEFVPTTYSFTENASGGYVVSIVGYHEVSTYGSCYTETVGILLDENFLPTYGEYTAKYSSNYNWDFNNHQPSSSTADTYTGTFTDITYVDAYEEKDLMIDVDDYFVSEITEAYAYGETSGQSTKNTCKLEESIQASIVSYNPTGAIDTGTYSLMSSSDESIVSVNYGYGIAEAEGTCTLYLGNLFNPQAYAIEFTVAGQASAIPTLDTIVDENFVANEAYSLKENAADEILGTLTIPSSSTTYTTRIKVFGYKKPADSDNYTKVTTGPWNLDSLSIKYNDDKDLESTSSVRTWSDCVYSVSVTEDDEESDAYLNMTIRIYGWPDSTYVYFPVSDTTYNSGNAASKYVIFEVVIA